MTDAPYGGYPATERPLEGTSPTDAAKESGQRVASTAVEQGKNVLEEGKTQARNLTHEVGQQAHEQSKVQKDKAASGLRSLGTELQSMAASQGGQSGLATDLAQQAAAKVQDLAGWLDQREPGELLDEVRALARRKPGTFLLGALAAGVVAGRLTRGAVDATRSDTGNGSATDVAATPTYDSMVTPETTVLPEERLDVPAGEYSSATAGGYR
jgi:hypothetical protein